MEVSLLLASHGRLAVEMLRSAELIVGPIANAFALTLDPIAGPEALEREIQEVLKKIGEKPLLAMVDLLGGSPGNIATLLLSRRANTALLSGFNLGMVLEFALAGQKDLDTLKEQVLQAGQAGIKDVILAMHATDE